MKLILWKYLTGVFESESRQWKYYFFPQITPTESGERAGQGRRAWPSRSSHSKTHTYSTIWSRLSWRAPCRRVRQNSPTTQTLSTNLAPCWRSDARKRPSLCRSVADGNVGFDTVDKATHGRDPLCISVADRTVVFGIALITQCKGDTFFVSQCRRQKYLWYCIDSTMQRRDPLCWHSDKRRRPTSQKSEIELLFLLYCKGKFYVYVIRKEQMYGERNRVYMRMYCINTT